MMKNAWRFILGLLLLAAPAAQAQFNYTTNNGAIIITGYTGPGGAVAIPATINSLPVTSVGTGAFAANATLTSVTISGSVTNIGTNAFENCANLTNASLGGGVVVIASSAFQGCSGLVNLTIPNSVTNLGFDAFYQCSHLTNIYFLGNAPITSGPGFFGEPLTAIYYFPGATGWGSTYGGVTTSLIPFTYALNPNNTNSIIITGYSSTSNSAAIPSTLVGLPVTAIQNGAFAYVTAWKTVIIPGSVTSIGGNAFLDDTALTSIIISNGVTSIGSFAFAGCSHLQLNSSGYFIPASVTNIGVGVFNGCSMLYSVSVDPGNSFYSAPDGSLYNQNQTTLIWFSGGGYSYTVPGTVTNIADGAINDSGLTNIAIPSSVIRIGNNAFEGCGGIKNIVIPGSVTSMGEAPFEICLMLTNISVSSQNKFYSSLNGVLLNSNQTTLVQYPDGLGGSYTIPGTVTNIADEAFAWGALTGITLPSHVTSIGNSVFAFSSLASITVPTSITAIGASAFASCSLSSVTIPSSVTNIGTGAFASCPHLTAITVDPANLFYSSVNGVLFNYSQTTLIQYLETLHGAYSIPSGVTSIGDEAFYNCAGLTSVTLPYGITNIGNLAFEYCSSLTTTMPGTVTRIGDDAFYDCPAITSVTIPGSVSSIGTNAFFECTGLKNVTISSGVPSLAYGMFQGCTGLTNAIIPASVTNLSDHAFAYCGASSKFSVYYTGNAPVAALSAFAQDLTTTNYYLTGATGWGTPYAGAQAAVWLPFTYDTSTGTITIDGYTGPGGNMFIPAAINGVPVTAIGTDAFDFNTSVTGVTIPNSVTNIEDEAFSYCSILTSVTIPGSVISIGQYAFEDCTILTNVTIASGVKSIGAGAFYNCSRLAGLAIPGSVTSIGANAFQYCALKNLVISNGVNSIGTDAFYGCSSLGSITIPSSVTNLGSSAFSSCSGLTNLYFLGNAPTTGSACFSGDNNLKIYYLAGTTGWSSTLAGVTTIPVYPQIQTSGAGFGIQGSQFGFNISWASGQTVEVLAYTNLTNPVATSLQTVTLTNGSYYFSEPFQSNSPARFYQLRSP